MVKRTASGTLRQHERPVWQPLLDLVGEELTGWFMWMHEIELADGTAVHAYKHISTRCYLHLTEDGRAFAYRAGGAYREIDLLAAVEAAFAGWEEPASDELEAVRRGLDGRARPQPSDDPTAQSSRG